MRHCSLLLLAALALVHSVDRRIPHSSQEVAVKQVPSIESCWPGGVELVNRNPGTHKPVRLPTRLSNATVSHTPLRLKLCISEKGQVQRAMVTESSGNVAIDDFYQAAVSTRTYPPPKRDGKAVRSVVRMTVNLYIK